jgi:hypothetical protein
MDTKSYIYKLLIIIRITVMNRDQVFVHHKNLYSQPGFEPGTSGFVAWTTRPAGRQEIHL